MNMETNPPGAPNRSRILGAPGIRKTQIMEQAADLDVWKHHPPYETGAIGLPFISKKQYGGELFSRDGVHDERDRGQRLR